MTGRVKTGPGTTLNEGPGHYPENRRKVRDAKKGKGNQLPGGYVKKARERTDQHEDRPGGDGVHFP